MTDTHTHAQIPDAAVQAVANAIMITPEEAYSVIEAILPHITALYINKPIDVAAWAQHLLTTYDQWYSFSTNDEDIREQVHRIMLAACFAAVAYDAAMASPITADKAAVDLLRIFLIALIDENSSELDPYRAKKRSNSTTFADDVAMQMDIARVPDAVFQQLIATQKQQKVFFIADGELRPAPAINLTDLLNTYETLLADDNLPERIAVQTVDLRALLEAAHPFSLTVAREQAYAHATRVAETYINGEYEAQGCAAQMIFDELRVLAKPKPSTSIGIYMAKIIDELSVDNFALQMKRKLAKKRAEGRSGWQNMNGDELSDILHQLVTKGDPVDVANLCMMLSENEQIIAPLVPKMADHWHDIASVGEREYGRLIIVGAFDGKGRWCATVRRAQHLIDHHNEPAGSLKKALRLKWEPTHYMELTAPTPEASK